MKNKYSAKCDKFGKRVIPGKGEVFKTSPHGRFKVKHIRCGARGPKTTRFLATTPGGTSVWLWESTGAARYTRLNGYPSITEAMRENPQIFYRGEWDDVSDKYGEVSSRQQREG